MPPRPLSPVHRFALVVAALGSAVGALAVALGAYAGDGGALTIALLSAGVLFAEMVPLKIARGGDDEEITLSTAFSFALLLSAGLPVALVAQCAASVVQDAAARKPAWRAAFNVGQYALALAAAAGVLAAGGTRPGVHVLAAERLPFVAGAGAAFFLVNFLVVGVVIALYQSVPILRYLRSDFVFSLHVGAVLLSLGPVLVAALHATPALYPACVLPIIAIYQGAQRAVRADREAGRDGLTRLANRSRLRQLMQRAIDEGPGSGFGVLLMDLDRFKDINDTLGHHHGDLLLQLVGERLAGAVRGNDVVGRLGGDEFVVLVVDVGDDAAVLEVADRIRRSLREPFVLEGLVIEVGASVGIAAFPAHGDNVDTLLQRADIAMYHAKRHHLGRAVYAAEHDHHSPAQLALAADLRRALGDDEIEPHYQLLVDLRTGRLSGVEALARWYHPHLGVLQPAAFLDVAESTGLIRDVTLRVLERSLEARRAWAAQGLELVVAVNVSVRTLLDHSFPEAVARRLADSGTSAGALKLEITESTLMADPATATAVLEELHGMGITLAVDDFGTGYSSLAYLTRLPVGEIKIDKSFVLGMSVDAASELIVRSTIELGHNLGLRVIAEGVEDAATLERLAALGCDGAQGYHLSRPLPESRVPEAASIAAPVVGEAG